MRWVLLLLIATTQLNGKIGLDICGREAAKLCRAVCEIKESGAVCSPLSSGDFEHLWSKVKILTPKQSMSMMFSLCWNPIPLISRPYFPVMGPGQLQLQHRDKVSFSSLLSMASAVGLPVPSQSLGKALHGDNSELFHIPCLKASPRFVAVVYAHRWKQQGRLSSVLAVLPPSSFLQTDGPPVQVMSQLHLANKSNNRNLHCTHKE